MDLLVGDFKGGKAQGKGLVEQTLIDPLATWIRSSAFFPSNVDFVLMDGIHSFVTRVLGKVGAGHLDHLYILDHAYLLAGATYEATDEGEMGRGREWNQVQVEFGNAVLSHSNLSTWEPTLSRLERVLGRGSHVVFMNCSVGRDPAFLSRLAGLWNCPVSGPTKAQYAAEILNLLNPQGATWTTVGPDKRIRQSKVHPIWGTSRG